MAAYPRTGSCCDFHPCQTLIFMKFPSSYLVYDFETTGLEKDCQVLEIGARFVQDNKIWLNKTWLIKSPTPVPPFITELTGITDELLATEGVDEGKAFREFASVAVRAEALVGHNIIRYDNPILQRMAEKYRVAAHFEKPMAACIDTAAFFKAQEMGEEHLWNESLKHFQERIMDTKSHVKFNLALAHEKLGFSNEGIVAHRASGDIEMTYRIFLKMTGKM